jgi:predicted nucleic acid-binding protein
MNNQTSIVLDTNTLMNYLEGYSFETDLVGDKQIIISEITEMEVQCNPNINSDERKMLKDFLTTVIIIPLTQTIKEIAIGIRLTTRMKLMDAIIGATAQQVKISLVTCDEKFDSLKTVNVILLPAISKR